MVTADVFTRYVVDNYCWDRPGHRGVDGSQLGTPPGTDIFYCLWEFQPCQGWGYLFLEVLLALQCRGRLRGESGRASGMLLSGVTPGRQVIYRLRRPRLLCRRPPVVLSDWKPFTFFWAAARTAP